MALSTAWSALSPFGVFCSDVPAGDIRKMLQQMIEIMIRPNKTASRQGYREASPVMRGQISLWQGSASATGFLSFSDSCRLHSARTMKATDIAANP